MVIKKINCLAFFALVMATSCANVQPHVVLPNLPSHGASEAERLEAYSSLRPRSYSKSAREIWNSDVSRQLELADGTKIHDISDLLPVIDASSGVASKIKRAMAYDFAAKILVTAQIPAYIIGAVMLVSPLLLATQLGNVSRPVALTGASLILFGTVLGLTGGVLSFLPTRPTPRELKDGYDEALRSQLRLAPIQ